MILHVWLGLNFIIFFWVFPQACSNVPAAFQCTLLIDVFGTMDPFGSNSSGSKGGFADFSQMSKVSFRDGWSYESVTP